MFIIIIIIVIIIIIIIIIVTREMQSINVASIIVQDNLYERIAFKSFES